MPEICCAKALFLILLAAVAQIDAFPRISRSTQHRHYDSRQQHDDRTPTQGKRALHGTNFPVLEKTIKLNLFKQMDYDRNGALNIDETTKMLSQLMSDVSDAKVALHFIEADRNLNQQLNFPEFEALLSSVADTVFRAHLFDNTGDDFLAKVSSSTDSDLSTARPSSTVVDHHEDQQEVHLTLAEARKMLNSEVKNYSLLDLADFDKDYRVNISEAFAFVDGYQTIDNFLIFLRTYMENADEEGLLDGAGFTAFLTSVVERCAFIKATNTDDCSRLRTETIDREFYWNEGKPPVSPAQEIALAKIMFIAVSPGAQQSEDDVIRVANKKRSQLTPAQTVLLYPAATYAQVLSRFMT